MGNGHAGHNQSCSVRVRRSIVVLEVQVAVAVCHLWRMWKIPQICTQQGCHDKMYILYLLSSSAPVHLQELVLFHPHPAWHSSTQVCCSAHRSSTDQALASL